MTEVEIESDYVSPELIKTLGVSEVMPLEEFKPHTTDFGQKYGGKVQVGTKQKIWEMNNTSAKICAKVLGKNTLNWIGKRIAIVLSMQNTPNGMKDVIYVDELRTVALNPAQIPPQSTVATSTATPSTSTAGSPPAQ